MTRIETKKNRNFFHREKLMELKSLRSFVPYLFFSQCFLFQDSSRTITWVPYFCKRVGSKPRRVSRLQCCLHVLLYLVPMQKLWRYFCVSGERKNGALLFCLLIIAFLSDANASEEKFRKRLFIASNGEVQNISDKKISPEDLKAEMSVFMKNGIINIKIKVIDDLHSPVGGKSAYMYKGDSVQLAFHPAEDEAVRINKSKTSEIGASLALNSDTTRIHKWYGPLKIKKVKCIAKRTGKTTKYDFQIPLNALGFKLKYPEILFSVLINDNDNGKRKYIEWNRGIAGLKSPAMFGHLALNEEGVCLEGYDRLCQPGQTIKFKFGGQGKYEVKISAENKKGIFDRKVSFPGSVEIPYSSLREGLNRILISVSKNGKDIYRCRRDVVALDIPDLKKKMATIRKKLDTSNNRNLLEYYLSLFDRIMKSGEYIKNWGALLALVKNCEAVASGKIKTPEFIDLTKTKPPKENLLRCGNGKGYGHQGLTYSGKEWFVFHTDKIFRYEKPDFTINQKNVPANMNALDYPILKKLVINHLGAPYYFDGTVYTFGKSYLVKGMNTIYLLGYDAETLDFKPETMHSLKMPKAENGYYSTSGGPVIRDGFFYCVISFNPKKGKKLPCDRIGKFKFPSGEFVEFIPVKGETYSKPQGLFMDKDGNFYIPETYGGIKMYDYNGNFKRYIFKTGNSNRGSKDIHEGLFYDPASGKLAFSMTTSARDNGHGDYVVQVNLKKDKYRFVDGGFGDDNNLGYDFADAKKTINAGIRISVPGVTLLISGYTKKNPARETIKSFFKGEKDYPATCMGYPEAFYITGSDDFSAEAPDCLWKESSAHGEYYLVDSKGKAKTKIRVQILAACPKDVWEKDGIEGVAMKKEGKPGSLNYGEWGWGNVDGLKFKTLYYKPEKDEKIDSLHIEAGQRDNLIVLDKPFNKCRNVKVFLPNSKTKSGITISSKNSSLEKAKL